MAPVARHGDLLPLPATPSSVGLLSGAPGSRRCRQQYQTIARICETATALNYLGGHCDQAVWPVRPVNSSQVASLARIRQLHLRQFESRRGLSLPAAEVALSKLLRRAPGHGYASDLAVGSLVPYEEGAVSLPTGAEVPCYLLEILPSVWREVLETFEDSMLLSQHERDAIADDVEVASRFYFDPTLEKDEELYARFVVRLFVAKVIDFTTSGRVVVGLFFVSKKNGSLRFICDARRSNALFRRPPRTVLGSMESWARISLGARQEDSLYVAQEDVKDYFFRLIMPEALRDFFCLPALSTGVLLKAFRDLGAEVPDCLARLAAVSKKVSPRFCVLPMGFSWAFHFAHVGHEELAVRSLPTTSLIRDRMPVPDITQAPALLIYADNADHIGTNQSSTNKNRIAMSQYVNSLGLSTHDVVDACTKGTSLGISYDGVVGVVAGSVERSVTMELGCTAILQGSKVTGHDMKKILGHATVKLMLRRPLFSIFRHAYTFADQVTGEAVVVWASVRYEIWLLRALLVFAQVDLRAGFSDYVLMTDACLSGYGVAGAKFTAPALKELFDYDERWRFKEHAEDGETHRERALRQGRENSRYLSLVAAADPLSDPITASAVVGVSERRLLLDRSFPDIPVSLIQSAAWKPLYAVPLTISEPVHLCEARSFLSAIKHASHSAHMHGLHILVLGDNMGVVLACSKGRATSFALLRILQRIAAECLAAGIVAHFRWLPSEFNRADGISRLWERGGPFFGTTAPRRLPGNALWRFFNDGAKADEKPPREAPVPEDAAEFLSFSSSEALSVDSEWSDHASALHEEGGCSSVTGADIAAGGSRVPVGAEDRGGGNSSGLGAVAEAASGSLGCGEGTPALAGIRPEEERGPEARQGRSSSSSSEGGLSAHSGLAWRRVGSREPCRFATSQGGLRDASKTLLGVRAALGASAPEGQAVRRRGLRLGGLPVPRRRGMPRGRKAEGCLGRMGYRFSGQGLHLDAAVPPGAASVEEECPEAEPASNAGGVRVLDLCGALFPPLVRDGAVPHRTVLYLFEALGFAQHVPERCGAAGEEGGRGIPRSDRGTVREAGLDEDRVLRRDGRARRRRAARARRTAERSSRCEVPSSAGEAGHSRVLRGEVVGVLGERVSGRVARRRPKAGAAGVHGLAVSGKARGSVARLHPQEAQRRGDQGEGPLVHGGRRSHLQKARSHPADGGQVAPRKASSGKGSPEELRQIVPRWIVPRGVSLTGVACWQAARKRFLSIYGGVGRGAQFLRLHGFTTALIDLADNSRNDSCHPRAGRDFVALAGSADLGIDLPCNSWTLARRAPLWSSMPHRLRTAEHPFGLPELEGRDLDTARIGNFQVRQAVRLIRLSLRSGKSGYLENPATSRAWIVLRRMFHRELSRGEVRIIQTDMCGYGTAFKKPTCLLIWGRYSKGVCLRRCNGKGGLCGHSGVAHLQLTGVKDGVFLTHHAQIYCRRFVSDFLGQLLLGFKPK